MMDSVMCWVCNVHVWLYRVLEKIRKFSAKRDIIFKTWNMSTSCAVGISQVRSVQSIPEVMSQRASGLNVASVNCPVCPEKCLTTVLVSISTIDNEKSSNATHNSALSLCTWKNVTASLTFNVASGGTPSRKKLHMSNCTQ